MITNTRLASAALMMKPPSAGPMNRALFHDSPAKATAGARSSRGTMTELSEVRTG